MVPTADPEMGPLVAPRGRGLGLGAAPVWSGIFDSSSEL